MGTPQLMTWHYNKPSTAIVGRDNAGVPAALRAVGWSGAAGNDLGRTYR